MQAEELSQFWEILLEPLEGEVQEFIRQELVEAEQLCAGGFRLQEADFAALEKKRLLASTTLLSNSAQEVSWWRQMELQVRSFAASSGPLTAQILCQWNASLQGKTSSGYRQRNIRGDSGTYLYFENINASVERLIELFNTDFILDCHPVLRAARIYRGFISIHPFEDGNGRTGRLLADVILLRGGYPPMVMDSIRDAFCAFYVDGEGLTMGHAALLMIESLRRGQQAL